MVLSAARRPRTPALVVPDEQTWTVHGVDPATFGVEPAFEARRRRRLLAPERLPEALAAALAENEELLAAGAERDLRPLSIAGGVHVETLLRDGGHGHDHADGHRHEHGDDHDHGHEHHDMMAIVGDPSPDGLVMEPIDLTFGPLGTTLPGGLLVEARLDGDVVARSSIRALLRDGAAPDALAPVAWRVAMAAAAEHADGVTVDARARWLRVAAVELERAISHLAWLRSMGRLLDWPPLISACERTLEPLQASRAVAAPDELAPAAWIDAAIGQPDLDEAGRRAQDLAELLAASRSLRWRLHGRGVVTPAVAREHGLAGPAARASGLAVDARTEDPLYAKLAFRPVVRSEGDALDRTLVRVEEVVSATALAGAAVVAAHVPTAADDRPEARAIEGPRGPVQERRAADRRQLRAPGSEAARSLAADAMVGLEWSAALAVLISFDLSPWSVDQ